jgi:hypothetical protein
MVLWRSSEELDWLQSLKHYRYCTTSKWWFLFRLMNNFHFRRSSAYYTGGSDSMEHKTSSISTKTQRQWWKSFIPVSFESVEFLRCCAIHQSLLLSMHMLLHLNIEVRQQLATMRMMYINSRYFFSICILSSTLKHLYSLILYIFHEFSALIIFFKRVSKQLLCVLLIQCMTSKLIEQKLICSMYCWLK